MAGLTTKYEVRRADDGEQLDDVFVLRVRQDPLGWLAAWYYASMTQNMELAQDMRQWLLDNAPTQETLGDEGRLNAKLLDKVMDTANKPDMLPRE